jgi:hypothetical protein
MDTAESFAPMSPEFDDSGFDLNEPLNTYIGDLLFDELDEEGTRALEQH